ncbi:hypothetical protein NT98_3046 [Bacillus cereus]|nr:hypothetical protein NT98_3046 [Bacillus cereus]
MLLNELNNMKCTVTSEKKKNNILSRLELIYQNMKLDKLYHIPVSVNNELFERVEKESLHTIEDGVNCLHYMLDMNYEKIKQYGSNTSRSFVPLSQSSICLADCICFTGFVLGLLGAISFGGFMLSICSIT